MSRKVSGDNRFFPSCPGTNQPYYVTPQRARVVKWQTRTFEGRMPKGMGVQVPPRAPLPARWANKKVKFSSEGDSALQKINRLVVQLCQFDELSEQEKRSQSIRERLMPSKVRQKWPSFLHKREFIGEI